MNRARALLFAIAILATPGTASAFPGTLPRGDINQDGRLDYADALVLSRHLNDGVALDKMGIHAADLGPVIGGASQPDGKVDLGDLVVMFRVLGGELGPPAPLITSFPTLPPGQNPMGSLAGTGPQGTTILLFARNGGEAVYIGSTTVTGGEFSFSSVPLPFNGTNEFYVVARDANGFQSAASLGRTASWSGTSCAVPSSITEMVVWTAGCSQYDLPNGFAVNASGRLILGPGVLVQSASAPLTVNTVNGTATLQVLGTATRKVRFTSSATWPGIKINLTSSYAADVVIDHATIERATTGMAIALTNSCCAGSSVDIRNSEFKLISTTGINVEASTPGTHTVKINIDNVTMDNIGASQSATGVSVKNTKTNPTDLISIKNSLFRQFGNNIYVAHASPLIQGNTIKEHYYHGIDITDGSKPVIQWNIFESTGCYRININVTNANSDNYVTPIINFNKFVKLPNNTCARISISGMGSTAPEINARNNYWGSDVLVPSDVDDVIDRTSGANVVIRTLPILDQNLNPIGDETVLYGSIEGTLDAGATYLVDGPVVVDDGDILTIPGGTTLKFLAHPGVGGGLKVKGTLHAGDPGPSVEFATATPTPHSQVRDWDGISAEQGGVLDIENAVFSYVKTAISVKDISDEGEVAIRVRDSLIQYANQALKMTNVKSALIDGLSTAQLTFGAAVVELINSSPRLINNTIENSSTAIGVSGPFSAPVIGPGNLLKAFSFSGISMSATGGGVIDGNTITNANTAYEQYAQGIVLIDASPIITGNEISETYYGIHVFGSSEPEIRDGNLITGNVWGILLRGDRANDPDANPAPLIERNELANACGISNCANQSPLKDQMTDLCPGTGGNLCVFGYRHDLAEVINARENYWDSIDAGDVRDSIFTEKSNPIPVDVSDFLDQNGSVVPGTGSVLTSLFENVTLSPNPPIIRPTIYPDDEVTISFELLEDADDVTFRIFEDLNPAVTVYTESLGNLASGAHAVTWAGKTSGPSPQFVADEAYGFEIAGMHADLPYVYKLELDPPEGQTGAYADPGQMTNGPWNAHRNNYIKALIRNQVANAPIRVRMVLAAPVPPSPAPIYATRVIAGQQKRLFVFDGRTQFGTPPDGAILTSGIGGVPDPVRIGIHGASLVGNPTNPPVVSRIGRKAIFVQDTAPSVYGENYDPSPPTISDVEVLSDPYLVDPTYDQVSMIRYQLDQDADVWIRILKPGAFDASTPADVLAELVSGVNQIAKDPQTQAPLVHTVTWLGYVDSDPANTEVLNAPQSGSYTFLIEAEHPNQPALKTLYRGTIQVRLAPGM